MKKLILFGYFLIKSFNYHPKATIKMLMGCIKSIFMGGKLKYIYNMTYNVLVGACIMMGIIKKKK
jgi:hypothetical protein